MSVCCPAAPGPRVTPAPCLPSEALLQERQPQQQHHQQLRAQQQQQPELRRRQQRQQHLQQEQLRLHARYGGGAHGRHGHPQPVHALPRDAAEPVHQAAGPVHRAGTCGRAAAVSRWLRSAAAVACGPGPRSSGSRDRCVPRPRAISVNRGHHATHGASGVSSGCMEGRDQKKPCA